MIVNGKDIAQEIVARLAQERAAMLDPIRLGVVMPEGDAATASFVRIKERVAEKLGVELVRAFLPATATTNDAIAAIHDLAGKAEGVIVQLPLPQNVDTDAVLRAIPLPKDADALNSAQTLLRAPVAEAVSEIFERNNISAHHKKAVVVGAGRLVGAPVAELLRSLGAWVSVVTLEEGSLSELLDADIVVSGAGSPGMILPSMLKEGVVLIDAGTSEQSGRVVGDADPLCAEVASIFTPVPGGVGPIAVAMLFKNLFTLLKTAE